jgi:type I restriction enzyme, S subunit
MSNERRFVTLDEIADIRRGASPRPIGDPRWFSSDGPGWVRIADVTRSNRYLRTTEQRLSMDAVARSVRIAPGEIIMSICATIGKPIISAMDACIHDGFVVFRNLRREVSREFLYYFLQWKESEFAGRGQPGTQKNLNTTIVGATRIPLPGLPEQRKIAAILSSVDDAIEKTQAVIEQVQVVKKGLMQELLTRGLPGRHTKFKQTDIGEVPETWEVAAIGELCQLSGGNGFTPRDWSRDGLPIIRIQNLNGSLDFNYYAGIPDLSWVVEPGDLLFAWAGTRGASFGPCLWSGPRGVLNQHIHRVTPNRRVTKQFMYYLLRNMTSGVERRAHGFKQTLVHLRKHELTTWKIAVPSRDEQQSICEVLQTVESRLQSNCGHLQAMRSLKSVLMSVLLTGEVRVTPDTEVA